MSTAILDTPRTTRTAPRTTAAPRTAGRGLTVTIALPDSLSNYTTAQAAEILQAYAEHLIPGARADVALTVPPTSSRGGASPLTPTSGSPAPVTTARRRGEVSPLAPARRDAALRLASLHGQATSATSAASPASANPAARTNAAPTALRGAAPTALRGAAPTALPRYRGEGLLIDFADRSVTVDGETVEFTYKEFELLTYLAENSKRTVGRDELMETVWAGAESDTGERTVDVHVRRVRNKLARFRRVLTTARGVGYRFDPNNEVFFAGR